MVFQQGLPIHFLFTTVQCIWASFRIIERPFLFGLTRVNCLTLGGVQTTSPHAMELLFLLNSCTPHNLPKSTLGVPPPQSRECRREEKEKFYCVSGSHSAHAMTSLESSQSQPSSGNANHLGKWSSRGGNNTHTRVLLLDS